MPSWSSVSGKKDKLQDHLENLPCSKHSLNEGVGATRYPVIKITTAHISGEKKWTKPVEFF